MGQEPVWVQGCDREQDGSRPCLHGAQSRGAEARCALNKYKHDECHPRERTGDSGPGDLGGALGTKMPLTGGLNGRHWFLAVLEAGQCHDLGASRVSVGPRSLPGGQRPRMEGKEIIPLVPLLRRVPTPFVRAPPP